MSAYSTLIYKDVEYQFKTGHDDCCIYRVGDLIDWKPNSFWPGSHIDGVHEALAGFRPGDPEVWVIIKDCVLTAVEPRQRQRHDLEAEYGIKEPDRKLWTKKQWKAKADREAAAEAEWQAWKKIHGDNPCGFYIHKKMNERSIIDQILPATKIS